jgi:hypothetical protein
MQDHHLIPLILLLAGSVLLNLVFHRIVICRLLYKQEAKFPTGFLFWRIFPELRRHSEIRKARGKSLDAYYIAFILTWFNLLLAFGILVRVFYDYTQLPQ